MRINYSRWGLLLTRKYMVFHSISHLWCPQNSLFNRIPGQFFLLGPYNHTLCVWDGCQIHRGSVKILFSGKLFIGKLFTASFDWHHEGLVVMVGRYRPVYDLMGHGRGLVQMVDCIQDMCMYRVDSATLKPIRVEFWFDNP